MVSSMSKRDRREARTFGTGTKISPPTGLSRYPKLEERKRMVRCDDPQKCFLGARGGTQSIRQVKFLRFSQNSPLREGPSPLKLPILAQVDAKLPPHAISYDLTGDKATSISVEQMCRYDSPENVWRIFGAARAVKQPPGRKLLSSIGEVGAGGGIRTHAMPGWKPGAFPLGDARSKIGPGSGS